MSNTEWSIEFLEGNTTLGYEEWKLMKELNEYDDTRKD